MFQYVYVGAFATTFECMCVAAALTAFIFIHSFSQRFQRRNTTCFRPSTAPTALAAHSHMYLRTHISKKRSTTTAIKVRVFHCLLLHPTKVHVARVCHKLSALLSATRFKWLCC